MNKLWLISIVLLMILLSACDDSSTNISEADIIGSWTMTGMELNGSSVDPETEPGIPVMVNFNSDGTATFWASDYGDDPTGIDIGWRVSGTTLYVTFPGEAEEGVPITLTGSTLTINVPDWDDGVTAKLIYAKVNPAI